MLIGTNADPHHGFMPADLAASGIRLVRFPLWLGFDYGSFIAGTIDAGMDPVLVIDQRSFTASEISSKRYLSRLLWWAKGIPNPKYVQVGNEPDQPDSGSSWYMKKTDFWRLVRNCQAVWPDATIIAGQLVRIDFSYLDGLPHDKIIASFAPYAQTAESLPDLVAEIRKHWDGELWATEVGVPKAFYPTVHDRAVWHTNMLIALWRLGVGAAIQFPWGAVMAPEFDGMVDAAGTPTEVYAAVSGAVAPLSGDPVSAPTFIDRRGTLPTRGGRRYPLRDVSRVDMFVAHYTASSPQTTVDQTAAFQVGPTAQLPFPEIAYHWYVEADGALIRCHDFDRRTWGSDGPGVNERAIHCCYAGNMQPNTAQLAGIQQAAILSQDELGEALIIEGHKDRSPTSCPGPTWPLWRAGILP